MKVLLDYQTADSNELAHTLAFYMTNTLKLVNERVRVRRAIETICEKEGGKRETNLLNPIDDLYQTNIIEHEDYLVLTAYALNKKSEAESAAQACSSWFYNNFPEQTFFLVHLQHEIRIPNFDTGGYTNNVVAKALRQDVESVQKGIATFTSFRLEENNGKLTFVFNGANWAAQERANKAVQWIRKHLGTTPKTKTNLVGKPEILSSLEMAREKRMRNIIGHNNQPTLKHKV